MTRLTSSVFVCCLGLCFRASGQVGVLTTVAGNGSVILFSGDGGPATAAALFAPVDVAVDSSRNIFIADLGNNRIRKVSPSGIITTVAGNGPSCMLAYNACGGLSGDGGIATSAMLNFPLGIAVDALGNLFIADSNNSRIRKVSPSGIITTVAGNGTADAEGAFSGDGGPATAASLFFPSGVAVDPSGNLFIADYGNNRIRKVSASGIITTVAGNGNSGFSGDGGPAISATLHAPSRVAVDVAGNLFIVDSNNNRIRKVSASGMITTVAGNGNSGFSGDGGPATSASLNIGSTANSYLPQGIEGVTADAFGNLFIADFGNNRIRKVSPTGIITTVAGGGTGNPGAGGPATLASLGPVGVALDASGNLIIADYTSNLVLKISNSVAPFISPGGIVPVDSTLNTIQPGEWVSIYGNNLASSTVSWSGNFPKQLGGTSVTIDGKAAYISYVSPTQINLQAPDDTTTGPVPMVVTTASGTASSTVTLAQFAPSFLLLDGKHVTGIILRSNGSGAYGGGSYDIIGPTGNSLGYPTVAAKSGDVVELFALGLGPTSPSVPAGQAFSSAATTASPVNLLINDDYVGVAPSFAGLSSAGLYQIDLTVPPGMGTGDFSLVATVGGLQTLPVLISLQADAGPGMQCASVAGPWNVSESGSYSTTLAATAETDTVTDPIDGNGSTTIAQAGCSIQYDPIGVAGLTGSNLTASQLTALTRTGTVSGDNVNVTGLLALVDIVESALAGFTVTDISSNVLNGSGQVSGSPEVMTLNETGLFVASGTYSLSGQSGSFTETITTSSTANFMRGGIFTTVAGNGCTDSCLGSVGFSGDGGPATSADLNGPSGVAVDAFGNLFIADTLNNRVRKVSTSGIITTVAGTGVSGFSGDGGLAASASLSGPVAVAVDASGNLFIVDAGNDRIRRVSVSGFITTVAGNGNVGFSGDGGLGTSAELNNPSGVAVDTSGNLFIVDSYNNRIRKLSTSGIITTVAGDGETNNVSGNGGFSGDGGPATSAAMYYPTSVAVDGSGNLFIADEGNYRVRKVSASGTITTVAGNGVTDQYGATTYSGEGGPATAASLLAPGAVAVDVAGNLFILDGGAHVREVSANNGLITTVVGGGYLSFATREIALDKAGNLFVADYNSIQKVSFLASAAQSPFLIAAGQPFTAPTRSIDPKPGLLGIRFKALASSAVIRSVGIWLH